MNFRTRGFTLIEILVVLAILAILFAIVLVAINPPRQISQANDVKRKDDLNVILNSLYQYSIDHSGFPSGIATTIKVIGTSGSGCAAACGTLSPPDACIDLSSALAPIYVNSVPFDPKTGSNTNTRYGVWKSETYNRITIKACDAENESVIEVSR